MLCKILGLVFNTWTIDDKYSLLNRENLTQLIQMQLSQKEKTFSECFSAVLKCKLTFEHSQKEGDSQSWCVSEITESEKRG